MQQLTKAGRTGKLKKKKKDHGAPDGVGFPCGTPDHLAPCIIFESFMYHFRKFMVEVYHKTRSRSNLNLNFRNNDINLGSNLG